MESSVRAWHFLRQAYDTLEGEEGLECVREKVGQCIELLVERRDIAAEVANRNELGPHGSAIPGLEDEDQDEIDRHPGRTH